MDIHNLNKCGFAELQNVLNRIPRKQKVIFIFSQDDPKEQSIKRKIRMYSNASYSYIFKTYLENNKDFYESCLQESLANFKKSNKNIFVFEAETCSLLDESYEVIIHALEEINDENSCLA